MKPTRLIHGFVPRYLSTTSVGAKKPIINLVILGGGWAGYRLATDLDKSKYSVTVISPRNHFLFTPLLPSTAVGTLEFRCIEEPIRTIPDINYYQASAESVDLATKTLTCYDAFDEKREFKVTYDKLVLACGSETNTFGIKGVEDSPNVFFLKQLSHARSIRNRLIECFERASFPGCNYEEKRKLLTFIIVGGGPTSIEFAAEIYDFTKKDVSRCYPDLLPLVKIKVIEASGSILGTFARGLSSYVERLFAKRNVQVLTNMAVAEISGSDIILKDGSKLPFGLVVWSTGVKQVPLVNSLQGVLKAANGRLLVDDQLRVLHEVEGQSVPVSDGNVYAMGDCAVNKDKPLPQLAQVASQQAQYLSKAMNKSQPKAQPFLYHHLVSPAPFTFVTCSYTHSSIVGLHGECGAMERCI